MQISKIKKNVILSKTKPTCAGRKSKLTVFVSVLLVVLLFLVSKQSFASTDVNLYVEGCNNNNICEAPAENEINCSNDCTPCNHNGVCELLKGETALLCPSDCQTVATTTVSTPVIVAGEILNLNIKTGINYAIISWNTSVPTLGSVSWGKGDSYNDGIVNGINITSHHEIIIENLSASTTYSYFINSSLPEYYYARNFGTFSTFPIPEIKIIPSINNLIATQSNNEIVLSWNNPDSTDFQGVKIVRSPFFYPTDPSEGKVVYDGNGTYTRDSDLSFDTKYFYSAFSYDENLNYSSGVVAESLVGTKQMASPENASMSQKNLNLNILPIKDFVFSEGDLELSVSSSTVRVYPFDDLKIIIGVNRFATGTKSLILRIKDPIDISRVYSYSFALDSTKNFFYSIMPNLNNSYTYPFTITAYGLDNKAVYISYGNFDVRALKEQKTEQVFDYRYMSYIILFILGLFSAFLLNKNKIH